jgi:hypothetical protein
MHFISQYKLEFIGIVSGSILGYAYHHYLGCNSGCAISSNALNSSIYGALMGYLALGMFKK